jgi:glycosyltransferase involved in cell wall biosynthesis
MNPTQKLRICLVGQKIQIQSRATDKGLLWPLAQGLTQNGHEVTIISTRSAVRKSEVVRDGIKAYFLYDENSYQPKSHKFSDLAHKKFVQLHQKNPFDIVHSVDDSGFKIGRHKKGLNVRVAYDINATGLSNLFAMMSENSGSLTSQIKTSVKIAYCFIKEYFLKERALLQTADGIFTTTPQQRIILERYFSFPDYHTYTIPYGINLGDLTERQQSENWKAQLNLPEEAQIILAVSDFSNSMELEPLLQAFRKVVLKNSNYYLIIIGDGTEWKKVEYTLLKLVLGKHVIMTGELNDQDIQNYIINCEVYVNLSSRTTGLEPSMIEAMAQKKIVIGSELSPISEYITDSENGFLVRPADQETLSDLLISILNTQSHPALDLIGEKARQKVLDSFNRDTMINNLINSYYQILTKTGYFKKLN